MLVHQRVPPNHPCLLGIFRLKPSSAAIDLKGYDTIGLPPHDFSETPPFSCEKKNLHRVGEWKSWCLTGIFVDQAMDSWDPFYPVPSDSTRVSSPYMGMPGGHQKRSSRSVPSKKSYPNCNFHQFS